MQKVERVRQYETEDGTEASRVTTTNVDADTAAAEPVQPSSVVAARIVWFITGVIIAILAIRFILILLAANAGNGFVNLIYTLSYPFAVPFFGIFGYTVQAGVSQFELSTLVAIAVYALLGYGIARLLTIRRR